MHATFLNKLKDVGLRRFSVPLTIMAALLLMGISEWAYHRAETRMTDLVTTGRIRLELLHVARLVTEAESVKRGHLLDSRYPSVSALHDSKAKVLEHMDNLKRFYASNHDTKSEAARQQILALIQRKFDEMELVLTLYDTGQQDKALDIIRSYEGRDLMSQLQATIATQISSQNVSVSRRIEGVFDTLLLGRWGVALMTALSLMVLVRYMRERNKADRQYEIRQTMIKKERDELENEIAHRTAELTELARHLQTAREDERAHLARELHDELGALLTAAKLDVARIRPKVLQSLPEMDERLSHLIQTLNSGIALKRRIIEDLRPSTLSSLGLCPALEILCADFAERTGITVIHDLHPLPLSPSAELTVFRTVQEALTNIAKYAKAKHVNVTLIDEISTVALLEIQDDGIGFDPEMTRPGSHGLMGMRFRLEAERGTLQIQSRENEGTYITARIPLQIQPATVEPMG